MLSNIETFSYTTIERFQFADFFQGIPLLVTIPIVVLTVSIFCAGIVARIAPNSLLLDSIKTRQGTLIALNVTCILIALPTVSVLDINYRQEHVIKATIKQDYNLDVDRIFFDKTLKRDNQEYIVNKVVLEDGQSSLYCQQIISKENSRYYVSCYDEENLEPLLR